jgi:CHRD domain
MKRLAIAVLGLLIAAGCSSSSSTPSSTTTAGTTVIRFTATLLPANETPPITNSEASGRGDVTIDLAVTRDASNTITAATTNWTATMTGFPATTTTLTGAHIHTGATGVAGGIIVNPSIAPGEVTLVNGAGNFTRVAITVTPATAQQIVDNPAGFYFNIHTATNPGGVARGQLVKQ